MRVGVAGLVLAALALQTSQRAPVWKNDGVFWEEAARQMPANPRALMNAQQQAIRRMDFGTAEIYCDRLLWLEGTGGLLPKEQWFTDRVCLSR